VTAEIPCKPYHSLRFMLLDGPFPRIAEAA
jgi:hypothetical protein